MYYVWTVCFIEPKKSFMCSVIVCMTQQLNPSLQLKPFFLCVDTLNFFYVIFYASLHSTRGYRLHLMDFDHFLSSSTDLVNNRRQLNDSDVINRGWCINEISQWSDFIFFCWYLLRFQAQPHYFCFLVLLCNLIRLFGNWSEAKERKRRDKEKGRMKNMLSIYIKGKNAYQPKIIHLSCYSIPTYLSAWWHCSNQPHWMRGKYQCVEMHINGFLFRLMFSNQFSCFRNGYFKIGISYASGIRKREWIYKKSIHLIEKCRVYIIKLPAFTPNNYYLLFHLAHTHTLFVQFSHNGCFLNVPKFQWRIAVSQSSINNNLVLHATFTIHKQSTC